MTDSPTSRTSLTFPILIAVGLLVVTGGIWLAVVALTIVELGIEYPGVSMGGYKDTIIRIAIATEEFKEESQPVFVSIEGLPVRSLTELQEAEIQRSDKFHKVEWGRDDDFRGTSYKDGRGNICTFEDGKLIELHIYYPPTTTFRFGSSPNGPFFGVPMSQREVIQVFGPPKQVERTRRWRSVYPWH